MFTCEKIGKRRLHHNISCQPATNRPIPVLLRRRKRRESCVTVSDCFATQEPIGPSCSLIGKFISTRSRGRYSGRGSPPLFCPSGFSIVANPVSGRSTSSPTAGVVFVGNLPRRKTMEPRQCSSPSSLTTRSVSLQFSACTAAVRAINSSTVGSPSRIIRFLNLDRFAPSTADVENCQPAIWYCRTGWDHRNHRR